jgi:hypothetical protein
MNRYRNFSDSIVGKTLIFIREKIPFIHRKNYIPLTQLQGAYSRCTGSCLRTAPHSPLPGIHPLFAF